jgi:membrane protein YdbS with pleckstrin-like domain
MKLDSIKPKNWPLVLKFTVYPVVLLLWLSAVSVTFTFMTLKNDVAFGIGVGVLGFLCYLFVMFGVVPAIAQIRKWAEELDE